MVIGWFGSETGWYYMNPDDGAMLEKQWFKTDGKWYYATKSGIIAGNTYVEDSQGRGWCWCDSEGAWDEEYTQVPDLKRYGLAE